MQTEPPMWNSSDMRHLPLNFSMPTWLFCLAGLGALCILGAAGFGLWWVISHLQWVS